MSLLKTNFFYEAGGYDPIHIVTGVEDRDLGRRIALIGNVAYTPSVVAQVRVGEVGSSTNWKVIAEGDRWGRDKALQIPNALNRMRTSANTSYWRGRGSRAYFASTVWNLKRGNLLVSVERLFAGFSLTGSNIFSADYWRGLRTKIK